MSSKHNIFLSHLEPSRKEKWQTSAVFGLQFFLKVSALQIISISGFFIVWP
jgi:hypothetical protein